MRSCKHLSAAGAISLLLILTLPACSPEAIQSRPLSQVLSASEAPPSSPGSSRVLLTGVPLTPLERERAEAHGVRVEGEAVLTLEGEPAAILKLELPWSATSQAVWDAPLGAVRFSEDELAGVTYLAGREFGLEPFLSGCPECDGRGVKAGVLDDGVSVLPSGFQVTSSGERKFLRKGSGSGLLTFKLNELEKDRRWEGLIDEASLVPLRGSRKYDLNLDGKLGLIQVSAFRGERGLQVCVAGECHGVFSATGEYGWWNRSKSLEWTAEFNPENGVLSLTEGERMGLAEAHGEGCASVLLGYRIGGLPNGMGNGVAPGAQLLDYDIWAGSSVPGESLYTMGQFLRGLEWFGRNGADVVNISYAFHFSSAASQDFMREALDALVKRYGYVLGFSAGNDGPGMKSLHRRGIYPASVLVTGAYLSPELAEAVNGEADVPKEGRLAYYSSRGPGPDGGSAPVVIAPVSSLVHRTPGAGYSSFSGTSSASPAAAGLAAVLISAARKEGLPIQPVAVVHALRLSGKPLPDTAFIDQGYGIPQIGPALEIYRRLIRGQEFAYAEIELIGRDAADGIAATGLLIRTSEEGLSEEGTSKRDRLEFRANLRGVLAEGKSDLIRPVLFRYSHPWLSGPKRLWLANAVAKFSLDVDLAAARFPVPGGELNGEVSIIDEETGRRLHVIPVTLVDDFRLEKRVRGIVELGTEEGTRLHFYAPPGVVAVQVSTDLQKEMQNYLELKVYDSSGNMTYAPEILAGRAEELISIARPGWHQLAFYRKKGAGRPFKLEFSLEPVSLSLASGFLNRSKPVLEIMQHGTAQDFWVDLFSEATLRASSLVQPDSSGEYRIGVSLDGPGEYSVETLQTQSTESSEFAPDCYWTREDSSGQPLQMGLGRRYRVPETEKSIAGRLVFSCRAFEHLGSSWLKNTWKMSVNRRVSGSGFAGRKTWVRLAPGMNRIALEAGGNFNADVSQLAVWLRPVFGAGFVRLGALELF